MACKLMQMFKADGPITRRCTTGSRSRPSQMRPAGATGSAVSQGFDRRRRLGAAAGSTCVCGSWFNDYMQYYFIDM